MGGGGGGRGAGGRGCSVRLSARHCRADNVGQGGQGEPQSADSRRTTTHLQRMVRGVWCSGVWCSGVWCSGVWCVVYGAVVYVVWCMPYTVWCTSDNVGQGGRFSPHSGNENRNRRTVGGRQRTCNACAMCNGQCAMCNVQWATYNVTQCVTQCVTLLHLHLHLHLPPPTSTSTWTTTWSAGGWVATCWRKGRPRAHGPPVRKPDLDLSGFSLQREANFGISLTSINPHN